jgi:vacuolar-type H+-ATPase subunit H
LVFQASGSENSKTKGKVSAGADFKDLQLIKESEERAIKAVITAKKKAERIIASAEHDMKAFEEKALVDLNAKLEREYQLEEEKAKSGAIKIKEDGNKQAEQLKSEVQVRMPKAVEYIVKSVMGSN